MHPLSMLFSLVLLCSTVEAQVSVPLLHFPTSEAGGYGSYINIQLGTPAQAVSVLVDTGSSTLAVPPSSCAPSSTGCSEVNCLPQCPLQSGLTSSQLDQCVFGSFDSLTSTSAQDIPGTCNTPSPSSSNLCGFSVSYGQSAGGCCGMQGFLVQDTLSVGSLSTSTIVGQIQQVQSGFQEPPAAGIFGFAYEANNYLPGSFSSCGPYPAATAAQQSPSSLTTLLTSNNLANTFSMCFGSLQVPGVLTLGGTNSQFYTGSFQYTPILQNTGYYTVTLNTVGIVANSVYTPVSASAGAYDSTILDSGTSTLVLPTAQYNALENIATTYGCSTTAQCNAALSIYISLQGISELTIPGMFLCATQYGVCTLNAQAVSQTSSNPILGYPLLSSYYVTFERSNFQAGFATVTNCGATCSMHTFEQGCVMQAGCEWNSASSSCSTPSTTATAAPATAPVVASTLATVAAADASGTGSISTVGSGAMITVVVVPAILGLAFLLSFVVYRHNQRKVAANSDVDDSALLAARGPEAADSIYQPGSATAEAI